MSSQESNGCVSAQKQEKREYVFITYVSFDKTARVAHSTGKEKKRKTTLGGERLEWIEMFNDCSSALSLSRMLERETKEGKR